MLAQRKAVLSAALRPVFDYIDVDRSGQISVDEVISQCAMLVGGAGSSMSAEQARRFLQEHDQSGDDMLDFHEFCVMMMGAPDTTETRTIGMIDQLRISLDVCFRTCTP